MNKTGMAIVATTLVLGMGTGYTRAQQVQPGAMDIQAAMQGLQAAMAGATNAAEVVDFNKLKELLPAALPDMKRTNAEGEKTSAGGMTVSTASGQYESEKGASMSIRITDMAGTGGMTAMALAAWSATSIDKESDSQIERTGTIAGYKSHEEYNKEGKSGSVDILIGKGFLVEVDGSDVTLDDLKKAAQKIDLKKLEALRK